MIKIAIMAVGGQGGGVLTGWITELAEANGWIAQSTAVAGVAQRTGATIYYIEMAPDTGRAPVFALAPAAGDVDILIAAEWMEAGRAVQRGFVTPDRTTLITSTHRALSTAEKLVPGDGVRPSEPVAEALEASARRVIAFDLQTPAVAAGSVISASLFGALAGSDVLPFGQASFEQIIRAGGRSVEPSLAAFQAGLAGPSAPAGARCAREGEGRPTGPEGPLRGLFESRIEALPDQAREMAWAGLAKVVDFQDTAYGEAYLDRVEALARLDATSDKALSVASAKYVANAMTYDDLIRVADLKTRPARFDRIEAEMGPGADTMHLTEFLHPRLEELLGVLPPRWAQAILKRGWLAGWLGRRVDRGRRVRTDTIRGFLMLWLVAGLRRWRRKSHRHAIETAHIEAWLDKVTKAAARDPALAIEILTCRRLIKGYSDTHARGGSKFDKVLSALPMLDGRKDAADWLRRLREAALKDEDGEALDGALRTIASFSR